jgi:hypothetical protein
MPTPKMPDRTVPAANADLLGDDARTDGKLDELPETDRQDSAPQDRGTASSVERGEARPGQDENQAGFLKEKDTPGT